MSTAVVAIVAVVVILVLVVAVLRARRAVGLANRRTTALRKELSSTRDELAAIKDGDETPTSLHYARPEVTDTDTASHLVAGPGEVTADPVAAPAGVVPDADDPATTPDAGDPAAADPAAPTAADAGTAAEPTTAATEPTTAATGADTSPPVPGSTAAPAAPATPAPEPVGNQDQALGALWSLIRIRQDWTNRQSASIGLATEPMIRAWAGQTLGDVLSEEVGRIREDTGTPGTLRLALTHEPAAADSVLLVLSVQTLLDALSRHCQGYDLYVHEWERRLTAIVVCEGFDGPDRVATDASAVLEAIAPAGGEVALDRDAQGRLRARLSLSTSAA